MSKCLFCRPLDIRATKEEITNALLGGDYRPLVEYYRSVLRDDPDYLCYHSVSASLHLCAALKRRSFPHLAVVAASQSCSCCVIDALEEAISRLDETEVTVYQQHLPS